MSIGHKCSGGGATIKNSPINIHIHIHTDNEKLINKITRSFLNVIGQRHHTIENAKRLSSDDIQRQFVQRIED